MLLFVFFAGPTDFITAAMTNAIGDYFGNVIGMSLVMTPYTGEDWVERWTIFYWAWGLSWAPFVGSFIARISRGRTIREFVLGVIGMPVLSEYRSGSPPSAAPRCTSSCFEDAGIGDAVRQEISCRRCSPCWRILPGRDVLGASGAGADRAFRDHVRELGDFCARNVHQ
ncbi:MAG: BCCT family transporter [Gammaproteobacteria bacterium]|nr:BCCT family transporter [Gammaproteobacteria bacterium]